VRVGNQVVDLAEIEAQVGGDVVEAVVHGLVGLVILMI
jgi:hypothetical protein